MRCASVLIPTVTVVVVCVCVCVCVCNLVNVRFLVCVCTWIVSVWQGCSVQIRSALPCV